MKTAGIITMHAVANYGSYLQTYATCKYIEKMTFLGGVMPTIIDYRFPTEYHKSIAKSRKSEVPKPTWLQMKIAGLCGRIVKLNPALRMQRMKDFYEKYIRMTRPYNDAQDLRDNPPKFDYYITGSDQVWNPEWVGEDTSFMLSWVKDEGKMVAYGASFAIKQLPKGIEELYKKQLMRYDAISVREKSDILQRMGLESRVVLDPTFLLNKEEWSEIISSQRLVKKKYILCYLLRYTYDPYPYVHEVIKWVKKQTDYEVVIIGPEVELILKGYKVMPNCGPLEFLNLFANAEFVITSSFHGTSFAINFNKQFFTILDNKATLDNRQVSLIETLGLSSSCMIKKGTPAFQLAMPNLDYSSLTGIEECRNQSKEFLRKALE